ncbi:acyltransferase family protein [Flavitalea sp.]|nr:acyltransferase family protein [Flavitalea sp.]
MEVTAIIDKPEIKTKLLVGNRLHGIDALRGFAMMLGILLHATIAYKVIPLANWPHDLSFNHWTFDLIYHYVHSFRMPLFFLIAGYFSRLLFIRMGEKSFIYHRSKKILIPLLFSVVFILPFTILPFLVSRELTDHPGQWNIIFQNSFKGLIQWNGLAHLWFLYYLLIYYVVVVAWFRLGNIKFLMSFITRFSVLLNSIRPGSIKGIVFFSALVWMVLSMSKDLYLHVDTGLFPNPEYLLFYALLFLAGWLVNKHPVDLQWITNHFRLNITVGSILCILLFLVEFSGHRFTGWQMFLLKMIVAFQIIILVYGVIGFFLRHLGEENKKWRYISDASYFIYLMHLGLIAWLQLYFTQTYVPGIFRFMLVVIVPILISLFLYENFVRYTIIGEYLHGKREKNNNAKLK